MNDQKELSKEEAAQEIISFMLNTNSKQLKNIFDMDSDDLSLRARKAHDASCLDVLSCKEFLCHKWIPDNIVATSIEPVKFDAQQKVIDGWNARNKDAKKID